MVKKIFVFLGIFFITITLSGCTQSIPGQQTQQLPTEQVTQPKLKTPIIESEPNQENNLTITENNIQPQNNAQTQPDLSNFPEIGEEDISSIEGIEDAIKELDQIE